MSGEEISRRRVETDHAFKTRYCEELAKLKDVESDQVREAMAALACRAEADARAEAIADFDAHEASMHERWVAAHEVLAAVKGLTRQ